jgi:iron complex transport system substrate-binding protein
VSYVRALAWTLLSLCAPCVAAQIAVTDALGTKVSLEAPARRVVSLAPHATEMLFAAGAGREVVGVLAPADWPPEARSVPKVGDASAVSLEGIVALRPDLIVTWPYLAPLQVERLRAMNIAIYVSDPRAPAAIADDLERLGALTGHAEYASGVAAALRTHLHLLGDHYAGALTVRVFYEIWDKPMYTVGGAHLITAAIELCGGRNIFGNLPLPAPEVSVEAVLAAAPDAIVAGADGAVRPPWLDAWRTWKTLPAVRLDNLFVVDANLLHRAGPRFVDGAEQLCAALSKARSRLPPR